MAGKVVVGVDGSQGSRIALRWAIEEARIREATLLAVTVWQYPVITTMPAFGVLPPSDQLDEDARTQLNEVLREEGALAGDIKVLEGVSQGPAAAALIEASADADLLVVGSRGHGGFSGLLLGSVSQHCVTHAPCPVVVVPTEPRR